ncbi:MAG: hypothetical protein HY554_06835 [Elusimicrobia bacterium]|nr:hypothetical protein [Elusimicrobiota bacterium]
MAAAAGGGASWNEDSARGRWLRLSIAGALYAGLTLLFFLPILGRLGSSLIGPPEDNMTDYWNTWHALVAVPEGLSRWFHTRLLFFPEGTDLHYNSVVYPNVALVFAALKLFGLSPADHLVALHNATILFSFFASALAAMYLSFHCTRNFPAALLGGYIFGFNPSHFAHSLHHAGVAIIQFIPVFVLFYLRYMERRRLRDFWLATASCVAIGLSFWYFLAYAFFFLIFDAAYRCLRERRLLVREALLPCGALALTTLAALSPLLVPMIRTGWSNPRAYSGGFDVFVADVAGLVLFPPPHTLGLLTAELHRRLSGNLWEATVYLGLANLVLLGFFGLRKSREPSPLLRWCLWGGLAFFLVSAGATLHIFGRSVLPLPGLLLERLPLLGNLRAPSRAIVFVYLFLGLAVSVVMDRLFWPKDPATGLGIPRLRRGLAAALVALLIVGDFFAQATETTPVSLPPAYDAIERDGAGEFAILDWPATYHAAEYAMLFQTFHRRPIVGGVINRKIRRSYSDELSERELPSAAELRSLGIKYLVMHKRFLGGPVNLVGGVGKARRTLPLVYEDGEELVFRVY